MQATHPMGRWRIAAGVAVAAIALAGCATADVDDEGDDGAVSGESAIREADLVYEGQLRAGDDLPEKTLHLTYDDGPGPRTVDLADYLAAHSIKATFFINGVNVSGRQRAIDSIIGRGHTLANHTQNHLLLPNQSNAKVLDEIQNTKAIIDAAQPNGPLFLRAPFAGWTESLQRLLTASPQVAGYVAPIHWDIGTRTTATSAADWDCWSKRMSVEACGDLYIAEITAKKRGVVLLHDIHNRTVEMTKYIIPKLLADGYRFTTMSEVPDVQAALRSPALRTPQAPNECFSGTLVKRVTDDVCVQSTYDKKWYRCHAGDWQKLPSNAECIERHALAR